MDLTDFNVVSLCDQSSPLPDQWHEAGATVHRYDLDFSADYTLFREREYHWKADARFIRRKDLPAKIDLLFAHPPCTHLAGSGARWWELKGPEALLEALSIADACLRIAQSWATMWVIENPVGRLQQYWGAASYTFNPCDYGGYLKPPGEYYTKRTCLWTSPNFVMPAKKPVPPLDGSKLHRLPPGPDRAMQRSIIPKGFAIAVFQANRAAFAR